MAQSLFASAVVRAGPEINPEINQGTSFAEAPWICVLAVRIAGVSVEPRGPCAVRLFASVRLDEGDRVLDGQDLLGCVVRDLDPEFFFERHDKLDRIQAIGS